MICVHFFFSEIIGWLNNPIREVSIPGSRINQASISDCYKYTIEIRLPSLKTPLNYQSGDNIRLIRYVQFTNTGNPYVWITNPQNITLYSEDRKNRLQLLKGRNIPLKRNLEAVDNN